MYYEEIDWIPQIPIDLLDSIDDILHGENTFCYPNTADWYATIKPNLELQNWIKNFFPYPVSVRYQLIRGKLPVHVDVCELSYKCNYLIKSGGKVVTRWWNGTDSFSEITYEKIIPERTWHKIKVDEPHDITELQSARINLHVIDQKNADIQR